MKVKARLRGTGDMKQANREAEHIAFTLHTENYRTQIYGSLEANGIAIVEVKRDSQTIQRIELLDIETTAATAEGGGERP